MRKIIVLSMITLDGVMQAHGGPEKETSGGFKYDGLVTPKWILIISGLFAFV